MSANEQINNFNKLFTLNVNSKTEVKQSGYTKLTYLSWSWAWAEFIKVYPDATYEIVKNEQGLPYFHDTSGAMVYTKVTANGLTHEMWLPVMDGSNKAMKSVPYEYTTKNGKRQVEAYTMFDINKTVMRCLVKNLAMFGLGLYIYSGEDLPETPEQETPIQQKPQQINTISKEQATGIVAYAKECKVDLNVMMKNYGISRLGELSISNYEKFMNDIKRSKQ